MVELSDSDVELFLLSHSQRANIITLNKNSKLCLVPEHEFNSSLCKDFLPLNSFVLVGFQSFITNNNRALNINCFTNLFVIESECIKKDSDVFKFLLNKSIRNIVNNFSFQNLAYE